PRQEVCVGYFLDLRAYHRPGSEIESIIVECRIADFELVCPKIMLAHEKGLQRGKGAVFVYPHVATEEKSGAAAGLVSEPVQVKFGSKNGSHAGTGMAKFSAGTPMGVRVMS